MGDGVVKDVMHLLMRVGREVKARATGHWIGVGGYHKRQKSEFILVDPERV